MKHLFFISATLLTTMFAPTAFAGDVEAGAAKALTCVACHGELGAKPIADYPIIAGQSEKYLLFTLKAYKNGTRPNAIMSAQLAAYDESDLADLAAYFAAQRSDLR